MPQPITSGLNSESDEVKSLSEERDTAFDNLGSIIESRLKESEQARLYDEKRWLRSYRNYRGIYGSDMAFRDSEKSKVFVKVTKTKVLAAYGQLIEVLFSQGKFPIGIFPTTDPTGVAKYAHLKPENMQQQDQRMDDIYGFEGDGREVTPGSTTNDILNGLTKKYGKAGFEEGPAPDLKTMPQIEPAEEAARNMEKLIHDQLEETQAISIMRHVLFEMCLLGTGVLKGPFNYEQAVHQWVLDDNGERVYQPKSKLVPRVEAVSCWDLYPDPDAITIDDADYVIMVCPYELNPYQFFGVGIPENMQDSQQVMNGHARMAIDNLALSGNLVFDVDETMLVPGQDMKVFPGKIFRRQSGQPGQAIHGLKFPNTANENLMMFDRFRQLADESTGIPSYSHGTTGVQSTTRTAAGMSMLMGAAALSIKTVIKNIDDYLLKPLGNSLFYWNMQFNSERPEIQGDLDIKAQGTSSLMQKEVRSQRLMTFMQTASNPSLAPFVKWHTCLKEVAKSLDIDPDQLINDPEKAAIFIHVCSEKLNKVSYHSLDKKIFLK
jgi:hypothetical protein